MTLSSHISELKKKHDQLSSLIETKEIQPSSDGLEVSSLKKQKLALKEQIQRLKS